MPLATRSIAICGAPLVGKRELLTRLAEAADCHHLVNEELSSGERIVRLRLVRSELARSRKARLSPWESPVDEIDVRLVSGAMFFEVPVIETVLNGAHMIVYVIATGEAGPDQDFQYSYFRMYKREAQRSLLPNAPWIWVLNKVDMGSTNPLEHHIPDEKRPSVIDTVAITGVGIEAVWKRIDDLLVI